MPKMRAAEARSDDHSVHGRGHEACNTSQVRRYGGEEVRLPLKQAFVLLYYCVAAEGRQAAQ